MVLWAPLLAHIFSEDAQLDVHGVDDLSFGYQERLQGIENKITFHANDVDTYCSSPLY